MKQCTCGRSKAYPYCDGTHKFKIKKEEIKDEVKEVENK
jgi:CDGSH-type Zn-finger protein